VRPDHSYLHAPFRDEQRRLAGEDKEVIEGTRYLLLHGEEKLDEHSPEKMAKLDEVLEANAARSGRTQQSESAERSDRDDSREI